MAAASDKARYFLEQSVPELKELERKKIFNSEEISSIARKRSDFEHKINARGSTASDFARYAEFEINVDALRRRRVKRMGIKAPSHESQRRIFFVFDRGTRKHPGDVDLYMQSIEHARKQKSHKKLSQILTNALRLHPTKPDLWIYAAKFSFEDNGDMTEARSYMQRALRFNKNSRNLWLEYVRMEMSYIAKLHARRRILGITNESSNDKKDETSFDNGMNTIRLPVLTSQATQMQTKVDDVSDLAVQDPDLNALMNGAIPITIYDAAMEHFKWDAQLNHMYFDLFLEYDDLSETSRILNHVIEHFERCEVPSWHAHVCNIQLPLFGVSRSSPAYPLALRESLRRLRVATEGEKQFSDLRDWVRNWLRSQVEDQGLDVALQKVLTSVLRSLDDSE